MGLRQCKLDPACILQELPSDEAKVRRRSTAPEQVSTMWRSHGSLSGRRLVVNVLGFAAMVMSPWHTWKHAKRAISLGSPRWLQ